MHLSCVRSGQEDRYMTRGDEKLIWLDLEMTGLNPFVDQILEVATVITDWHLAIVAEGPVIAIHQPDKVLEGMDSWNTRQHGKSGLIERVRQSHWSYREAEAETLEFVRTYVPGGVSPMCGNSICHDRRFLARLMPEFEAYFHYRNIDVSTIKELARCWAPELLKGVEKQNGHLALDDIKESIAELKHYRQYFFIKE